MKLYFHASKKKSTHTEKEDLLKLYGDTPLDQADCIVVLGGDGTMLRAMHKYADLGIPLYGMNLGTLGFLLNVYKSENLVQRIAAADSFEIHPLRMEVEDIHGKMHTEIAFNEVSVLRQTHTAAQIKISVNGTERMSNLVCDGVLLATSVGSTAYNSSAGGPIVPLGADVLPLTPISPFRPRRWSGALLRNTCEVDLEILHPRDRPVSATADANEVRDIVHVNIRESRSISKKLLYDPGNLLAERILEEQFAN